MADERDLGVSTEVKDGETVEEAKRRLLETMAKNLGVSGEALRECLVGWVTPADE